MDGYRHYAVSSQEVVSRPERESLISHFDKLGGDDWKVEQSAEHESVRQRILDLDRDEFADLERRVVEMFRVINLAYWRFDLDFGPLHQPLRICKYEPGYSHDWHMDYLTQDPSKMAMSVRLNDGYTGGALELFQTSLPAAPVGHGVFFPAFHGHRVAPVESGNRYVLLAWISGPRFR